MAPAWREAKDGEKLPRGAKPRSPEPSEQFLRAMRCQSESHSQSQKQKPQIHKILSLLIVSIFSEKLGGFARPPGTQFPQRRPRVAGDPPERDRATPRSDERWTKRLCR